MLSGICRVGCRVLPLCALVAFTAPAFAADDGPRDLGRLRKMADAGYIQQQIELAAAYMTGRGVPQDPAQAAHWYQKAAEGGSPEAQNQIGYFYQKGIGVPTDAVRSVHWFQLAASSGFALARVNLGIAYLAGAGVPKSPSTARQLFLEALRDNVGLAGAYLGDMDYFGLDGPMDRAAAESWFEKGAHLHDPVAAFDLAWLFSTDPAHPHDLARAAALLRSAAAKGYVPAIHALGLLLVNHPDLAQAGQEAATLLRESSQAGNWKSSVLMGILARDGRSISGDPALACYYFDLAVLQGGEAARRLIANDLAVLADKVAPEAASARAGEARSWYEQHRIPLLYVFRGAGEHDNFPLAAVSDSSALSHIGQ